MTPDEKNGSRKDEQSLKSASKSSVQPQSTSQGGCFEPGNVVWAYVKGHPWWPAVVSEDENGGDDDKPWYQMKGNRYHVQYLGPLLEHQWISPARLVTFLSKEQFVQLKLVDKKSVTNVCQRHREKWELAVKEAIDFLKSNDRVEMLNRKLVEAEQAKENIVKNNRSKAEPTRDLRICVYDSTTYLLDEKALSKLMEEFDQTKQIDNQKAKLTYTQFQLSSEDLRSCKSLNLGADAVIDLRIDNDSAKRETKSLTSSFDDSNSSVLSSRRSRSSSPRKTTFANIGSDMNNCQHLLIDVEIVEALQSSRSKLKQVVISHLSRLQEQLKYKYTLSPQSKYSEDRKPRKSDSRNVLTLKEAAAFLGEGGKSPIKRSLDKIQKQIEKQQLKEKRSTTPAKDAVLPEPEPVIVEVVDPFKALYADPNARDKICLKCEGDGKQMLACIECFNAYHVACLPEEELVKVQTDVGFKCADCMAGIKICFSCKESLSGASEGEVFQCTVSNCRKLYHVQCLDKYPALNENFSSPKKKRDKCPQHLCASCFPHDTAANKLCFIGKLTKCLKCPLAYHCGKAEKPEERCFPAGSAILSHNYIICPAHFCASKRAPGLARKSIFSVTKKKTQTMDHLNVNWCFFCGTGGDLILCELCPAAFHPKCVKLSGKPPDGKPWHCENCQAGLFPRFGDIVWVKCGAFRWWPAKISVPEEIPENIFRKQHKEGEFVVQFYGTKDFMWISIGRVFSFEENDTASKGTDSTLNKQFQKGLSDATTAHRELTAQRERELIDRLNGSSNSRTPAPYKYVTRNIPQGNVKVYKADLDNYATCSCTPDDVDPCGPSSNCENRYTLIECHPKLCAAGDKCQNQRFARAQYAETYYFKCGDRGWGLKNKQTIYPGQFVNEYCGDLIDYDEYERRLKRQNDRGELDFYFCVLDSKRVVDAKPKGCHSRFMNHSCEPNCDGQLWMVNGDYRVGLFAKLEIPPDTELTFNYNLSSLGMLYVSRKLKFLHYLFRLQHFTICSRGWANITLLDFGRICST